MGSRVSVCFVQLLGMTFVTRVSLQNQVKGVGVAEFVECMRKDRRRSMVEHAKLLAETPTIWHFTRNHDNNTRVVLRKTRPGDGDYIHASWSALFTFLSCHFESFKLSSVSFQGTWSIHSHTGAYREDKEGLLEDGLAAERRSHRLFGKQSN